MSKRMLAAVLSFIAVLSAAAFITIAIGQGPRRTPADQDRPTRPDRVGPPIGFDMGEVISVDPAANTVVLKSLRGQDNKPIKVKADAIITRRAESSLADVKIGEYITVRGVPTEMKARSIESSEVPSMLGGMTPIPTVGERVLTRSDGMATGKVISNNPLTIEVDEETQVVIKLDKTKLDVNRTMKIKLADLKAGEFVTVRGENDDEGNLTATSIAVTPERRPPTPARPPSGPEPPKE